MGRACSRPAEDRGGAEPRPLLTSRLPHLWEPRAGGLTRATQDQWVLRFSTSWSPGGLLSLSLLGTSLGVSVCGGGQRTCVSHKLPADAADPRDHTLRTSALNPQEPKPGQW